MPVLCWIVCSILFSQPNLNCLQTGEKVLYVAKLKHLKCCLTIFITITGDIQDKVKHGKQDNPFFRHCNENQWESICTDLTYESAHIFLVDSLDEPNIINHKAKKFLGQPWRFIMILDQTIQAMPPGGFWVLSLP